MDNRDRLLSPESWMNIGDAIRKSTHHFPRRGLLFECTIKNSDPPMQKTVMEVVKKDGRLTVLCQNMQPFLWNDSQLVLASLTCQDSTWQRRLEPWIAFVNNQSISSVTTTTTAYKRPREEEAIKISKDTGSSELDSKLATLTKEVGLLYTLALQQKKELTTLKADYNNVLKTQEQLRAQVLHLQNARADDAKREKATVIPEEAASLALWQKDLTNDVERLREHVSDLQSSTHGATEKLIAQAQDHALKISNFQVKSEEMLACMQQFDGDIRTLSEVLMAHIEPEESSNTTTNTTDTTRTSGSTTSSAAKTTSAPASVPQPDPVPEPPSRSTAVTLQTQHEEENSVVQQAKTDVSSALNLEEFSTWGSRFIGCTLSDIEADLRRDLLGSTEASATNAYLEEHIHMLVSRVERALKDTSCFVTDTNLVKQILMCIYVDRFNKENPSAPQLTYEDGERKLQMEPAGWLTSWFARANLSAAPKAPPYRIQDFRCHVCQKVGHIARNCPQRFRGPQAQLRQRQQHHSTPDYHYHSTSPYKKHTSS